MQSITGRTGLFLLLLVSTAGGESVRLPITRDTWFSDVGNEAAGNNGGAPRLKVKSYQEFSVFDVDTTRLRGRVIVGATLRAHLVGDEPLRRITVGSLGSPWVEGTGRSYEIQPGSSTFRSRIAPETPWTLDGGDLCRVILGQSGTTWKMADASPPDADGWQTVAVDPSVVAARVAGVSEGFLLFDDTGSEWTRDGETFTTRHMPNRFVSSRDDQRKFAPFLTVEIGAEDQLPPRLPGEIQSDSDGLPAGEARLSWTTPRDYGPSGVIGFLVTLDDRAMPRSLIPRPARPGERVSMHLRDLGARPGQTFTIAIRAVDGAGNIGPALSSKIRVSSRQPAPLPPAPLTPFPPDGETLPRLGNDAVAVIDELDKVQANDGQLIPENPKSYLAANHLWKASEKRIRLHAARNEFVAFQILVQNRDRSVRARLDFEGPASSAIRTDFGRYRLVSSKNGPLPDPVVPLGGDEDSGGEPENAKFQSVYAEVYVPHDVLSGEYRGGLRFPRTIIRSKWLFR